MPIVVIVLVVVVLACVQFAAKSSIEVGVSAPSDKEKTSYIYMIMFGGISDNLNGSKKEEIDTVNGDLDNFYQTFSSEYEKPYFVEAKYENISDKTIITFKGEVTDKQTGELVDYEKVFSYDFIITDKINYNGHDNFKYF